MALVFRCDGCGRLEGHDPRNKYQSKKAGTVSLIEDTDLMSSRDEESHTRHDLCKECLESFKQWFKGLVNTISK